MPKAILKKLKSLYHLLFNNLVNIITGRPSESLIVIGITGTKGKTSTVYTLYQTLIKLGLKVGLTSSVYSSNGIELSRNKIRNSMPGRGQIHKLMLEAKNNGATVFIVEVTSEGLAQNRHRGIHFDSVVITNLYPEHLEAHGGFENYKKAKGLLFQSFEKSQSKIINSKVIQPLAWVNQDDEYQDYYRGLTQKPVYSTGKSEKATLQILTIKSDQNGLDFSYQDNNSKQKYKVTTPVLGDFMGYNLLFVIGIAKWLGYDYKSINKVLNNLNDIPGRMNKVATKPTIFVDYAHIPEALEKVYQTINNSFKKRSSKTIAILGSCGGGRDTWKRSPMGKVAGQMNDYVIITDEDPYDENPQAIIDEVFSGVLEAGKIENQNAWRILSRREAFQKALDLAQKQDIIIITGKGSETSIMRSRGVKENWNDTEEILKLLK
ncbi:UDP-N-acetylmuramyl-tripeptide synthetase [bacterium]|nr:UDP-N-acetylmuramyl-tripeptide synthetase [Candidatus Elulimicrobium humile]